MILLQEVLPFFLQDKFNDIATKLKIPDNPAGRIVFIIANALMLLLIKVNNNPNTDNLTGVWKRFEEINKLHINWIDSRFNSLTQLDACVP